MIKIDTVKAQVTVEDEPESGVYPLASAEAFRIVSKAWLRAGWDVKHVYTFTWFGRPIIQLPEDVLRIQEVIYALRPTLIVETGVAHGGSLVFYASLFKAMDLAGRVVGVDIEIRPHNRKAISEHPLAGMISLLEGSSIDPAVVAKVRSHVRSEDRVLIVLDSNHTRAHVLRELEVYAPLVTVGSYIVATDGIMKDLVGAPRAKSEWGEDNPYEAAKDFLKTHENFVFEQPGWLFNESVGLSENITYWPGSWLKRVS